MSKSNNDPEKTEGITDAQLTGLLSMLDYDRKLAAMTPRELVFEVLGSRAADFRCVVALMDRVLPGWQAEFTDAETENGPDSTERHEPLRTFGPSASPANQAGEVKRSTPEARSP